MQPTDESEQSQVVGPERSRSDYRRGERRADSRESELGVSDVIGFTLMFGIIILSVGAVTLLGIDDIVGFGDREEIRTGERGMEAAAATIDQMNLQSDQNKVFDLVVGTGNVWLNETNVTFTEGPDELEDEPIEINSLEHRFDRSPEDISVIYEGGGVYRSDSIAARYKPAVTCTDETAIVSLVKLTTDDGNINVQTSFDRDFVISPTDIPEESPVAAFAERLTLEATLDDVESYHISDGDLSLDVSSTSNPDAWRSHLADEWDTDGDGYELQCQPDEAVVRIVTIDIQRGVS